MKNENIRVTPQLAKLWLEKNRNQRAHSDFVSDRYARDMAAGNWIEENDDNICFDLDGFLRNGQHRLHAIIKSGVTLNLRVAFDCSEAFIRTKDIGRARKPHETVIITQGNTANRIACAMIGALLNCNTDGSLKLSGKKFRPTMDEFIGYGRSTENLPIIEQIVKFATPCSRDGLARVETLCALFQMAKKHTVYFGEFLPAFYSIDGGIQQARVLRDWTIRQKGRNGTVVSSQLYGYAIYAMRSFVSGRQVASLNKTTSWDSEVN